MSYSIEEIHGNRNPLIGNCVEDTQLNVEAVLAYMQSITLVDGGGEVDLDARQLTGFFYLMECTRAAVAYTGYGKENIKGVAQ